MTYQPYQLTPHLLLQTELLEQIRKLYAYIASEDFIHQPEEERELLLVQLEQMQALSQTIQKRAEVFERGSRRE